MVKGLKVEGPVILVTGAAGFIGSHTAERLLAAGHRVVGVDNFRTGSRKNLAGSLAGSAFVFREADVAEPGVLSGLAAEFSPAAIIHLAALVSVQESISDPALNFRLNLGATHEVGEAARRHKIPRVVFASSAAVYGDGGEAPLAEEAPCRPVSPYGAAKLASEGLLLGYAAAYGWVARCQRYFNVYGPRQDPASPYSGVISIFARQYGEGRAATLYGDGAQTRDFISVHDVARANVIAATRPGLSSGIANICTGQKTSLRRLAAVFGSHYPKVSPPRHAPARAGDIRHSAGDASRAKAELGFEAEWTVEAGLAELIETETPHASH